MPLSRLYDQATSVVVPIVQRVFYFDRPGRRLMLYDGDQSDLPLVDHVADVSFSYSCATALARGGLLGELIDGPILGAGVNVFDADSLSIALVRVTVRLEAAADELRGTGRWFARAGRSTHGESRVHDVEFTFDVAPRNIFSRRQPSDDRAAKGRTGAGRTNAAPRAIVALLVMVLLATIGAALAQTRTTTDVLIASSHRHGLEASYAAEAALERALRELASLPPPALSPPSRRRRPTSPRRSPRRPRSPCCRTGTTA